MKSLIINRKQAPSLHSIKLESLPKFQSERLSNGVEFHVLNILQEELIQVELVLEVGKLHESKKMQLQMVTAQIKEGTRTKTAKEIADTFEYYGGSIKAYNSSDSFHLQLTCLTKFVQTLLPLLFEIFQEPIFPEVELKNFVKRQAQKLLIREKKVEFLADRLLFESMFGRDHFYGYGDRQMYLNEINQNDLIQFHQAHFQSKPLSVFVNGNVSADNKKTIQQFVEALPARKETAVIHVVRSVNEPTHQFLEREDAVQSALRVGRTGVPDYHSPDYPKLLLTNLIFGGFFGSRLMSNIREDKGYTYGIHSYPGLFKEDSYWMIATETGNAVSELALKEVYNEMDRMRNQLVPEDELKLVKNYFSGNLLNRLSGSFKVMRAFMELNKFNLNIDFYMKLEEQVKDISAKEILDTANHWFNPKELTEVTVGVRVSDLVK